LSFEWPALNGHRPVWTGHGFQVGGQAEAILDYEAGDSGWSEELTLFHEDAAGEGTHPIDVASRHRARRALKHQLRNPSKNTVVLEVGCSSGFLLQELMEDWPQSLVIGADYIRGPLCRLAERLPALPLMRFDLVKCPLPSASVDAVVLLNVLEHIEDDRAALQQVMRILKPGGLAVVEVPSGPHLYDVYDKYLHHFRRYTLTDASTKLEQAGLRVIHRSHLGFFVYPAFAMIKRRNRRFLNATEEEQRSVVERSISQTKNSPVLGWLSAFEEKVGKHVSYPFGIRCVMVASKPLARTSSA
jgi:ubiquinone/menaquinone biosynthesis C-methylase UbiE